MSGTKKYLKFINQCLIDQCNNLGLEYYFDDHIKTINILDVNEERRVNAVYGFGRSRGRYSIELSGGSSRPELINSLILFSSYIKYDFNPRSWKSYSEHIDKIIVQAQKLTCIQYVEEGDYSAIETYINDYFNTALCGIMNVTNDFDSFCNYMISNNPSVPLITEGGSLSKLLMYALTDRWDMYEEFLESYEKQPLLKEYDRRFKYFANAVEVLSDEGVLQKLRESSYKRDYIDEYEQSLIENGKSVSVVSPTTKSEDKVLLDYRRDHMHWIYVVSHSGNMKVDELLEKINFNRIESDDEVLLGDLYENPDAWYIGSTENYLVFIRPDSFEDIVDSCRLNTMDDVIESPLTSCLGSSEILTFYQYKETDILFSVILNQERNRATLYTSNGEFVEHRGELYPEEKKLQTDNELDNTLAYLKHHFKSITGFDSPYDDRFAKLKMIKVRPKC